MSPAATGGTANATITIVRAPRVHPLALYRDAPASVRVHVWLRWQTCPFWEVARAAPVEGSVLEIGCGHGLLATSLALDSRRREVLGIDVDIRKIWGALCAARNATLVGANLRFDQAAPGHLPAGPWDCIAIADVLYLLDPRNQRQLLQECAARLAPKGTLLIKEMALRPRWKFRWNVLQETISVRWLGLTLWERHPFTFVPPAELARWLRQAGLEVEFRSLDAGYLHPHLLLVGRRLD